MSQLLLAERWLYLTPQMFLRCRQLNACCICHLAAVAACVPAAAAAAAAPAAELQQVKLAARDTIFCEAIAAHAPRLVADTSLYSQVWHLLASLCRVVAAHQHRRTEAHAFMRAYPCTATASSAHACLQVLHWHGTVCCLACLQLPLRSINV
jgi:hypothetical protein